MVSRALSADAAMGEGNEEKERKTSMRMMVRPLVVSGPSGGGKGTLLNKLFEAHPGCFAYSVSHTTRNPRPGEVNGEHYWFVSKSDMKKSIEKGEFLEHAEFAGNLYGTSVKAVESVRRTGKICVLELELAGVRNIHSSQLETDAHTRPNYVFITPPSMQVLKERLTARGTEDEVSLSKRLARAEQDQKIVDSEKGLFDHVIVNDDLSRALADFEECIKERNWSTLVNQGVSLLSVAGKRSYRMQKWIKFKAEETRRIFGSVQDGITLNIKQQNIPFVGKRPVNTWNDYKALRSYMDCISYQIVNQNPAMVKCENDYLATWDEEEAEPCQSFQDYVTCRANIYKPCGSDVTRAACHHMAQEAEVINIGSKCEVSC